MIIHIVNFYLNPHEFIVYNGVSLTHRTFKKDLVLIKLLTDIEKIDTNKFLETIIIKSINQNMKRWKSICYNPKQK